MATLAQLAQSIAETASDYRKADLGPFTSEHVLTWVHQFDKEERNPVLSELDHVLKNTYFSEASVRSFLKDVATEPKLVGADPAAFWKGVGVLDVQLGGSSQAEMLQRFGTVLKKQFGFGLDACQPCSADFVYIDDAIFSGNRIRHDLTAWIEGAAPKNAKVHVVVNALHLGGEYYANKHLKKACEQVGKSIELVWWRARSIENRRYYKYESEVLWPSELPEDDGAVSEYVDMLKKAGYPPELRSRGGTPKDGVFSGEDGRAMLESAFLKAGARIRSMCPFLPEPARPLGYSVLKTLGFGATAVTFRNCPNNSPLALWAGDPWYPLFRRKNN